MRQIPLDEDSGELANGKDTTAVSIPYSSTFNIVSTGPNANGIEVRTACMAITYSKRRIDRVRLPILHVVS